MTDIRKKIEEKILEAAPGIPDTVAEALAKVEIDSRVNAITKAFLKKEELEKEFEKVNKPDQKTYTADRVLVEAYSEGRLEQIKKAEQGLNNLRNALSAAMSENTRESYKKLDEVMNKLKGNQGGNQGKPEADK